MKKILILILVALISITMFGCGKTDVYNDLSNLEINFDSDNTIHTDNDDGEGVIEIFGMFHYESGAFSKYNKDVEYELIFPDEWTYESYQAKQEEVYLQLMAGEGPDVIYGMENSNFYNLLQRDVFYDLKNFMNSDYGFSDEDYATEAINVGIIDGKQKYIPLSFYVPALGSFDNLLPIEGIKRDDYITLDKIKEMGLKYTGENDTQYFLDRKISSIFCLIDGDLINYASQQSNFKNSNLVDIFKMNDECYQVVPEKIWAEYNYDSVDIARSECSLLHLPCYYPVYINDYLEDGYNYYIYPIQRTEGENKIRCTAYDPVGISKSSNNKKDSFEFIKFKLSDLSQLSRSFYLPVNKEILFTYLDYTQNRYGDIDIGNFITTIKNIYANLEEGYFYDEIYDGVVKTYEANKELPKEELLIKIDNAVKEAFKEE